MKGPMCLRHSCFIVVLIAVLGTAACERQTAFSKEPSKKDPPAKFTITSAAFKTGKPIPTRYTGDGKDVSPPLVWTNPPKGTQQLALICDDPDAPTKQPWVHWVFYGLAAGTNTLPAAMPRLAKLKKPVVALQGRNSWNSTGYRGPAPPKGHGTHHYHFKLYALDKALNLKAGLDKKGLLAAMKNHVLGQTELVGTYSR